jgi:hypothetical protein
VLALWLVTGVRAIAHRNLLMYSQASNSSARALDQRETMTLDEFRQSLIATAPPFGLTHALTGLWWDAKGDWRKAHESAQQDERSEGSWVHAYLHRKEGDQNNAAYWYSRAGRPVCREPLDAEWLSIARVLLS